MERFSTLLLMLAGVAIGGYELMPAPPEDTTNFVLSTHVSAVPKIAASEGQAPRDNVRAEETARTFSPTSPAFRQRDRLDQANAAVLSAATNTGTWTTVVTAEQTRTTALKSSKSNDWQTRYELARDLQRELKRVGCYGGEITGVWTRASKAAMSDFMYRVNASLPVEQPDYVLLSLVQSHGQITCGAECPSGQVIAEGDRCVPRAVIAQASKKAQRLQDRRTAEARLAAGKMARSAPEVAASRPSAKVQALASAEPEKLPWLEGNGRSITTPPQALSETSFPGRMGMGGPVGGQTGAASLKIAQTHDDDTNAGASADAMSDEGAAKLPSDAVLDEQSSEGVSKTNSATSDRRFRSSARSRHPSRATRESRYYYGGYSYPRRARYVPLQRLSRMN